MRRARHVPAVALVIACTLTTGGPPASAEVPDYAAPSTLCTVLDPLLTELSGLVADGPSLFAVADGGQSLRVVVLDRRCAVTGEITAVADPFDVEDLALAADGALWLADIGDNGGSRETAALHRLTRDGQSTLFRLRYPDGPHDAEALLLDEAGRPFVVTKDPLGDSGVYTPARPLRDGETTPLRLVTSLRFAPTGTSGGPGGVFGQVAVTGGAVSADGRLVVLRTYTDAYVYPAPDGDVEAALTRPATRVALPPQPQGEAIAVDTDGASLLLAGEGLPSNVLRLPGVVTTESSAATLDAATGSPPAPSTTRSTVPWVGWGLLFGVATAVGIAGAVLVRRRRR